VLGLIFLIAALQHDSVSWLRFGGKALFLQTEVGLHHEIRPVMSQRLPTFRCGDWAFLTESRPTRKLRRLPSFVNGIRQEENIAKGQRFSGSPGPDGNTMVWGGSVVWEFEAKFYQPPKIARDRTPSARARRRRPQPGTSD
jgi:hypothetical protein